MFNSKQNRVVLVVSAGIILALVAFALLRDTSQVASLNKVSELVKAKKIQSIVQSEETYYIRTPDKIYSIPVSQVSPRMLKNYSVEVDSDSSVLLTIILALLALGGLSYGLRYWMKRESGESGSALPFAAASTSIGGEGEGITPVESDVTFDDIGGIADVKQELQEIIDFLRNPSRFKNFGARMPRGVLLVGPPGVGKTMIAKAVAAEAGVPFYYQSAASFVQIYVGMGAKRVHELFVAAKNNSPSIIFIDEIDAVGKERDGNRSDEREATLNQLLTEMDGFEDSSGVIVVAATNKIEVLDAALLRAGRFDRRVFVELPTPKEREAIINKYLSKVPNSANADEIVQMSVGFNGASLATLVNEAALLALREKAMQVSMEHFYAVKDKVAYGKKKLAILSPQQKQFRARYLAAKAVLAYTYKLPFEKVMLSSETIKPQMGAPMIQSEIEARIKVLLAGMAGCDLYFDEHATNVQNDLKQAKQLALEMVTQYGMGESVVALANEDVSILDTLYKETKSQLSRFEEAIAAIEKVLMEKESITKEHIGELIV
ncbi:MAG: AAA family ATPase [Campylobacterota bacterium]